MLLQDVTNFTESKLQGKKLDTCLNKIIINI